MNKIACPYCESGIAALCPEQFQPRPACCYSAARIDSDASGHFLIDSQLSLPS